MSDISAGYSAAQSLAGVVDAVAFALSNVTELLQALPAASAVRTNMISSSVEALAAPIVRVGDVHCNAVRYAGFEIR